MHDWKRAHLEGNTLAQRANLESRLVDAVIRLQRQLGRRRAMIHGDTFNFDEIFRAALLPLLRRGLLEAKIEALRIAPSDRERERRESVLELARVDDFGEPGAPVEL